MGALARLKGCESGVVYLEFLIAFFPIFLLFLGTVQLAFVSAAHLVVREAAARACRSAVVILDDGPTRHSTERGVLGDEGSRLAAIRASAYVPLAALSPPVDWLTGTLGESARHLQQAVSSDAARFALGYGLYNRAGAIVTLRADPGSGELESEPVAPNAKVTVHVTYLYYCAVPLVSRLICRSLSNLLGGNAATSALERLREDPTQVGEVLERLEADSGQARRLARELGRAESPALLAPVMLSSGSFAVLEAEMRLPNQGARYHGGYRE